jgi:hypothetical protein
MDTDNKGGNSFYEMTGIHVSQSVFIRVNPWLNYS